MKAAVCYEFGQPLVIDDVDLDLPDPGEVKVRLAATAICHSDIHLINGEIGGEVPFVPGHESAGTIVEVGKGVASVKPGDPVVVSLIRSCGTCFYCTARLPHLCGAKWPLDTKSRHKNKKGQELVRTSKVNGFAEYTLVDQSQIVKIPNEMPLDRAAMLACGFITGFGAVVNYAKVEPLASVVVIGAGGVGLNSIQGASFVGAHPIIAVDILDYKLERALDFGATHTVNAAKADDPIEVVKEITSGRGADYVFVTVGSHAAVRQGFEMSGKRGKTVIIGLAMGDLSSFQVSDLLFTERTLTGCFMGSTQLSLDIPRYVDLYLAGRIKLDELITARYSLDQINEAIASLKNGEALRNVIVFD